MPPSAAILVVDDHDGFRAFAQVTIRQLAARLLVQVTDDGAGAPGPRGLGAARPG